MPSKKFVEMELAQMKLLEMRLTHMERMQARILTNASPVFTLLTKHIRGCWRSLVSRAGGKRKALAVRETAALGDRRFVSVIQFERQRFLIGSSAASITLLAQLPDEFVAEESNHGEKN